MSIPLLGWDVPSYTLVIGLSTGLTYAILAAGLVLVYRATKVINFAHGEIGAFGAALLAKMVLDWNWPFFLALPAVIARQCEQTLHGSVVGPFSQLRALAKMRAIEVFPTPRGPRKRKAWPTRPEATAFFSC